jgi:tetratricopeptide (TPR) repeat protein
LLACILGLAIQTNWRRIMKATLKSISTVLLVLIGITTFAQRKITGIVYREGKPAAGVFVEGNKTKSTFYTSFDGVYELQITDKTKQLKFTYGETSRRLDISAMSGDVIDPFSFDGSPIPEAGSEPGAVLKTYEELLRDRDPEFSSNYSLYREFMKQGDIKSAYGPWKSVYKMYPKSTAMLYVDAQKIYEHYMEKATDTKTKLVYMDSIMMVFDRRIKYFDDNGDLLARKADYFLRNTLPLELSDAEIKQVYTKGFELTNQSIEKSGDNVEPPILVLYLQSARGLFSTNQIQKPAMLEAYERVMAIVDKQLTNEKFKETAAQVVPQIEQIIEQSGALDCNALIEIYKPRFENSKSDVALLKKMNRMLTRKNCTDSELFGQITEQLYKLEPSPEAAYTMARMFLRKRDYDKAFTYYAEAYNNEKDANQKAVYYYEAAMLALQHSELQRARNLVRDAINSKADYCEAFILLGDIYLQASRSYSGFQQSGVFWLAYDQYERAARFATCKDDANSKLSTVTRYFPKAEAVFLETLSEGDSYRVEGWINETTRVRVQK